MARPTTKAMLLSQNRQRFDQLTDFIDNLSDEAQLEDFPDGTMNRNIRDVLAHLHHWHLLFLGWYEVGMQGEKPDMPARGYTWKNIPELNRWIFEHYQKESLIKTRESLYQSYRSVQRVIESHTEEELFEKKRYAWTGSTSLGAYLISATGSHYDWALKLIRKARKSLQVI